MRGHHTIGPIRAATSDPPGWSSSSSGWGASSAQRRPDAKRWGVRSIAEDEAIARSGGCVLIRHVATLAAMDDNHSGTQFEIRISGVLSDRLLSAFPEMHARVQDHQTVLTGALPDQSALHGVLGRIEAFGLELLEVRRPQALPK
jgi:hypothetical protein